MKRTALALTALWLALALCACRSPVSDPIQADGASGGTTAHTGQEQVPAAAESGAGEEQPAPSAQEPVPMVMVDGVLYRSTGRESALNGRCGVMDGEIKSAVDPARPPARDDESNFGTGYGYQFVDGVLEVFMPDGTDEYGWMVFEPVSGDG